MGSGPGGSGDGGPGMPGRPGGPGGPGGPPGMNQDEKMNQKVTRKWLKFDELGNKNLRFATDILPMRVGIVVAAFPYEQQLEEFRTKLRFASREAQLAADPKTSVPQFLPVKVERREVAPDGKTGAWQTLDLVKTITPVMIGAGGETEDDKAELRPILDLSDALVMSRPKAVREGQYPDIESKLKNIEDTLAELKKSREGQIIKPKNRFKDEEKLNIFGSKQSSGSESGSGMGPTSPTPPGGSGGFGPASPRPPGGSGGFGPTSPAPPGTGGDRDYPGGTGNQKVAPKYCLVRFLDVTIEPGKSYNYRLKIRLANPNYGLKATDVAWDSLARDKELESDWVEVANAPKEGQAKAEPIRVSAGSEAVCYAVDQLSVAAKESKEKEYTGNRTPPGKDQTVVQVQRWMDWVVPEGLDARTGFPLGEWVIGERLLVNRGEFIRKVESVEVPTWVVDDQRYALKTYKRDAKKIPLMFSLDTGLGDALLVDFQGGDKLRYNHFRGVEDDKPKFDTVQDNMPTEILIMSATGKLLVHRSDIDSKEKERVDRYAAWVARLKEVKENKPTTKTGGPGSPNPFGPDR
jgi:hypothetical protein